MNLADLLDDAEATIQRARRAIDDEHEGNLRRALDDLLTIASNAHALVTGW